MLISACALLISVQEVHILRTQQKALMYPYVTGGIFYSGEGFGFRIKNSGNGLARVTSYQLFNDKRHFKDWLEAINYYMPEADSINYGIIQTAGNIRNEMLIPKEEISLFFLKWTPETRILQKRIGDLKISICYSSLLDEHWIMENGTPVAVDSPCKIDLTKEFSD